MKGKLFGTRVDEQVISSQRFLDEELIEAKRKKHDYTVYLSEPFTFEGADYRLLVDGHHSLEAARIDGVQPEVFVIDVEGHNLLNKGDAKAQRFLEMHYMDSDWYDVETGEDIW